MKHREPYSRSQPSRLCTGRDTEDDDLTKKVQNIHLQNCNGRANLSSNRPTFITNYVKVGVARKSVYKYSVTFSPDIDSTGLRYKLLCQHDSLIGQIKSFDGLALFTTRRLPEDRVGRGYYSPELKINIDAHCLSLWPGFNTSLRSYDGGLLWNIDSSYKLIRKECALDIMADMYFKSSDFQRDCARVLVGAMVITRYNNKTYRIDDIAWDQSPKDSFDWQNGQKITFIQYYKEIYGLDISDSDQPLLINIPKVTETSETQMAKGRRPLSLISLVPEFCFLTGITDDMRTNFRLMKDLSRHIHCSPSVRLNTIQSLVNLIHKSDKASSELKYWGLELSTSMHEVQGVFLPNEPIYGGKSDQPLCSGNNGVWHNYLKNIQPISCPRLEQWICIHTERDTQVVDRFMQSLEQSVRMCNLSFNSPKMISIRNDNTENYLKAIREELSQNPNIDLIMSVFPTQREDRYASFKKLLCCQTAIPSQALLTKTISDQRKLNTVANRIALQINCKLGGELWRVRIPMKSILVIGIDVYHCHLSKSRNSAVGFVSSLNDSLTRWFSRTAFQTQSCEIVESLRTFCAQAISKYYELNHQLPKKVIVYRDGIGDGQINASQQLEIEPILEAIRSFSEGYDPQLLYILVRKRIKTRYFYRSEETGDIVNPNPGSIIDESITTMGNPNFFLVSQNFTQGTVLPINLVVIYNSSSLTLEQIQRFTYKCTYLYYNWSGTVRVPAPCLYAHKVAYMAGQYLQAEASPLLSDKLYYL
ncbi:hypothetical protein MXB_5441 [Myxobolus squamalis]|nr:hypothetical protein MXB_5441 [Myxobolus squamalis]